MKSPLMIFGAALLASVSSVPALAQTAGDRELAKTLCADQTGSAFKICLNQQLRNLDCNRAGNRQQCEMRKQASQQCAGLFGWEFRQCTQAVIPQTDCSTLRARERQQCELNQSANAVCGNKTGEDHMNCLRRHFSSE